MACCWGSSCSPVSNASGGTVAFLLPTAAGTISAPLLTPMYGRDRPFVHTSPAWAIAAPGEIDHDRRSTSPHAALAVAGERTPAYSLASMVTVMRFGDPSVA
jgi:hypothetical protein